MSKKGVVDLQSFSDELSSRTLIKEVQLQELKFDHLDCKINKPTCVRQGEHEVSTEHTPAIDVIVSLIWLEHS